MGALTDKYCIVGVGETPHMRPSNRTTLSMACEAVSKAMADAGLQPRDIDGMTSYQAMDSTSSFIGYLHFSATPRPGMHPR